MVKIFNHNKSNISDKKEGSLSKDILFDLISIGGVVTFLSFAPAVLAGSLVFSARRKASYEKYKSSFYYLHKKEYIGIESNRGNINIKITKKGKKYMRKYLPFYTMKIKPKMKWDKKWHILIYDIPSINRIKRDILRSFIKRLGFYQLQKSVWVYSCDFKKELEYITNFCKLEKKEIRVIVSSDIGPDKGIRKFFGV